MNILISGMIFRSTSVFLLSMKNNNQLDASTIFAVVKQNVRIVINSLDVECAMLKKNLIMNFEDMTLNVFVVDIVEKYNHISSHVKNVEFNSAVCIVINVVQFLIQMKIVSHFITVKNVKYVLQDSRIIIIIAKNADNVILNFKKTVISVLKPQIHVVYAYRI